MTVAQYFPGAALAAVGSLPFPTNGPSVTPSSIAKPPEATPAPAPQSLEFPKEARILKPGDFRRTYDNGVRLTCPYFAAFCLLDPTLTRPRFGFTLPRALGNAVTRNRLRRRLREAVRLEQWSFPESAQVVFNPRRSLEKATPDTLRKEVLRVANRLAQDHSRTAKQEISGK